MKDSFTPPDALAVAPIHGGYYITPELRLRLFINHLSGHDDITLFHGTHIEDNIARFRDGIKLEQGSGDLHEGGIAGVDGAFYMTDSIYTAAQLCMPIVLCYTVMSYYRASSLLAEKFKWLGTGMNVNLEFVDSDEYSKLVGRPEGRLAPVFAQMMLDNDMLTSPMHQSQYDQFVTKNFRQYAVIKQRAIDEGNLTFQKDYTFDCNMVKSGTISAKEYTNGQKTDATLANGRFEALVHEFSKESKAGVDNWQTAFDKKYGLA